MVNQWVHVIAVNEELPVYKAQGTRTSEKIQMVCPRCLSWQVHAVFLKAEALQDVQQEKNKFYRFRTSCKVASGVTP